MSVMMIFFLCNDLMHLNKKYPNNHNTDTPFQLLGFYGSSQSSLDVNLALKQELEITVRFEPAFKDDLASRVAEGEVQISYQEHPHTDSVKLRGEVNPPS